MRWLHCSDFHMGKDRTAQERLVTKIIEHVKNTVSSGFVPDLVFITGDIANNGLKREYDDFRKGFLLPLRQALGGDEWCGRIIAVPGNHDVDRTKNDGFDREAPLAGGSQFFDPSTHGKNSRDILSPRFKAYRQGAVADLSGDWISKPKAAFAEKIVIDGVQFGVVGINTAWLSKDNNDRLKLTPGVELVEAALEDVKDCPVRFVLGHHPLTWLHEEHVRRLRAIFGHRRVIYLHGHMHKADGSQEDGAGDSFLVLQAGAAFQARDDEPWRNGLLWGEIDLTSEQVRLSPRFWNPDNYDWPVESGRFPEKRRIANTDWWEYPLPITQPDGYTAKLGGWSAPHGWELLTPKELVSRRHDVTTEEAEHFFDGAEPDWGIALCTKLPRRAIVGSLAQQLVTYRDQERPLAILLTGPGGEGKSMALRQILATAQELDGKTNILWHIEETSPISPASLAQLPRGSWIIATDAADLVAKSLFEAAAELRRNRRTDVRLLLCSRDTDWRASGAEKLEWSKCTDYRVAPLSGLTKEDADLIASAWADFEKGNFSSERSAWLKEKARLLFEATQHEAQVPEGSLLGGVLAVRHGAGLRAHVARLMDRLVECRLVSGTSLYDAFAYIAVMHAEGLSFLSRPVLAKALNCDLRQFGKQVIVPLAREAAATSGSILLTRHRRIAEAAVAIMENEFGEDIADRFRELARAAKAARREGTFVPELHRWDYDLPEHFISKSPETSIRIASELLEVALDNSKLAVNLARIYRKCDDPAKGADLLKSFTGVPGINRSFWYEWGTCEGNRGNLADNALLAGWTVADQATPIRPEVKEATLGLSGLGYAFGELYDQFLDSRFLAGCSAASYLGLSLPFDPTAHAYLEKNRKLAESNGIRTAELSEALDQLSAALIAAWEVCDKQQELLSKIAPATSMTFSGLARLVAH